MNADAQNLKKVNNIVDQLAGGATQLKQVKNFNVILDDFYCTIQFFSYQILISVFIATTGKYDRFGTGE